MSVKVTQKVSIEGSVLTLRDLNELVKAAQGWSESTTVTVAVIPADRYGSDSYRITVGR